jgi:hypothetical protein
VHISRKQRYSVSLDLNTILCVPSPVSLLPLRIRLKITFRFVDEISAYVGANSFALGDLSRPYTMLLVKIQGSYFSPCPKTKGWGESAALAIRLRKLGWSFAETQLRATNWLE